jgi:hypothetical protein
MRDGETVAHSKCEPRGVQEALRAVDAGKLGADSISVRDLETGHWVTKMGSGFTFASTHPMARHIRRAPSWSSVIALLYPTDAPRRRAPRKMGRPKSDNPAVSCSITLAKEDWAALDAMCGDMPRGKFIARLLAEKRLRESALQQENYSASNNKE